MIINRVAPRMTHPEFVQSQAKPSDISQNCINNFKIPFWINSPSSKTFPGKKKKKPCLQILYHMNS